MGKFISAKEARELARDLNSFKSTIIRKIEDTCRLHKLECSLTFEIELDKSIIDELISLGYGVTYYYSESHKYIYTINWR